MTKAPQLIYTKYIRNPELNVLLAFAANVAIVAFRYLKMGFYGVLHKCISSVVFCSGHWDSLAICRSCLGQSF